MALPVNHTLVLWRRHRGLTQATVARRAGILRPNLCAIERGRRDVSLKTLRLLAAALEVPPGMLVDGIVPGTAEGTSRPLSRRRLERVAEAVAHGASLPDDEERALAGALARVVRPLLKAQRGRRAGSPRQPRAARLAWLWLHAAYPPEVVRSLIQRISERS